MRLQSKNIEICHKTTLCRCLKYNNGTPGIGMEVARWIAEDVKAGVTGGDTWPVGAVCGAGTKCEVPPGCVFCVHAFL
jgi:hypothetical protein